MTIAQAILLMTAVWVGPRGVTYVRHMRPAPVERAENLARAFHVAAADTGISAATLLAMAYTESGLNSRAENRWAVSLMQLHRRTAAGRAYARACARPSAACDAWAVLAGARELERALRACRGLPEAVGFYRSGRCDASLPSVRWTMRIAAWLEGAYSAAVMST